MSDPTAQLVPFQYGDAEVRTVVIDGEPWFVLADLCKVLELANVGNVANRIDRVALSSIRLADGTPGNPNKAIVSEAGMYEVVIRSDKPEAVKFRRWLTSEVLPQIRKTGRFDPALQLGDELDELDAATRRTRQAIEIAREERVRADKAEKTLAVEKKHRAAIEAGDGIDPTTFGKKYFSEVPARKFDAHLYDHGYLIKQINTRVRPDGSVKNGYDHRKPTAKGRRFFYPHDKGNFGGKRRFDPRVRPQMEIALRDALAAEGLPVNMHSTGLVLLTNDDMKELGA